MPWCLTAPSHYLNQCQFVISELCGVHRGAISLEILKDISDYDILQNYTSIINY